MPAALPDQCQAGRWRLRRWRTQDGAALAAAARASWREVGPWLPWCHAGYDDTDAAVWIRRCEAWAQAGTAFEYGVFDPADGTCVGGVGLNGIQPPQRQANLGYWVRSSRHRQGIATAAARALATLGFCHLGLQRIEIIAALGNLGSAGVAYKAGATFEGIAPDRLAIGGRPVQARVFTFPPARTFG